MGSHLSPDEAAFAHLAEVERTEALDRLAALHFQKIELADEILVINVGGHVGESTGQEIEYARSLGRAVRYWEPLGQPSVTQD